MDRGHAGLLRLGSVKDWPAYNLFRHKLIPDLLCAVPQDCPVPGFIEGSTWAFAGAVSENALAFAGAVSENALAPAGLDRMAAAVGTWRNGFSMFQSSASKAQKIGARRDLWPDLRDALLWQRGSVRVREFEKRTSGPLPSPERR
jgi:hypothetical protein